MHGNQDQQRMQNESALRAAEAIADRRLNGMVIVVGEVGTPGSFDCAAIITTPNPEATQKLVVAALIALGKMAEQSAKIGPEMSSLNDPEG